MLLVNQIKVKPDYHNSDILKKLSGALKILPEDIISFNIEKKSIDARKKPDIFVVLTVSCTVKHEENVLRRANNQVMKYDPVVYSFDNFGDKEMLDRPVVVGAGPAGLFAAYYLALNGYRPIVLERGFDVDSRAADVEKFWETGILNKNSNVLFGEGGAGTFSDGKLNTLVKDKNGRNRAVLDTFVKYGADSSILYDAKPHVGTDRLRVIIKNMREDIKKFGGEFRFNAEVTDILIQDEKIAGVTINGLSFLPCSVCVLAIGHSARNTFEMLYDRGVFLEQKEFAVGLRVEHKQKLINDVLYTEDSEVMKYLPPASYKLVYNAENGRGVYSFCMCPGGYVVNASSEPGRLCVNGMSYSGRNGENANSAIVVSVKHEDFGNESPLAGIEFQRKLEERAYMAGNGAIPVERYGDFKKDILDDLSLDDFDPVDTLSTTPQTKGLYSMGKVSEILPPELSKTLIEGMEYFDRIIPGFAADSTLLSGVEARTSSPVRITRDDSFESVNIKGLYPSGEGAGYAGGITSAAMDGIKVFERIASIYKPFN